MTDTVREMKRADELKSGDWIAAGPYTDQPDGTDDAEVLHVHPYADGRKVAVTIQEATIPEPDLIHLHAEGEVTLLTAEEIAGHRADVERAARIAGIREFADFLERNAWAPLPYQTEQADIDFADVRLYAERVGAEVDDHLEDRTQVTHRIGGIEYRVIAWHRGGRPAGQEPVEHYETSGWTGGGPGASGVACACGVTFDGFDTLAEAGDLLRRHTSDEDAE